MTRRRPDPGTGAVLVLTLLGLLLVALLAMGLAEQIRPAPALPGRQEGGL